jgi:ABC-type antimicrobial peptide transport system permease subunit
MSYRRHCVLALLVGAIGVYSLISCTVSWRTSEIGLRLALGANRLQIARLVLLQSLTLALAGSALGIGGAVAATRLMSRFLFEPVPLTRSLIRWCLSSSASWRWRRPERLLAAPPALTPWWLCAMIDAFTSFSP